MKLCYLEVHIWDFYVEFPQIGTVKMLDIECGGSLRCVEVKYTTHSQELLSKVILQSNIGYIYSNITKYATWRYIYGTFSLAFLHTGAIKILDINFFIHYGCMKHFNTTSFI